MSSSVYIIMVMWPQFSCLLSRGGPMPEERPDGSHFYVDVEFRLFLVRQALSDNTRCLLLVFTTLGLGCFVGPFTGSVQ